MSDREEMTGKDVEKLASKIFFTLMESGIPPSEGIVLLLGTIVATFKALGLGKKEVVDSIAAFMNEVPPDYFDD